MSAAVQEILGEDGYLAMRWQKYQDDAALAKLMDKYHRLVMRTALVYRRSRLPMQDRAQEGRLGLLEAINRFDYMRGHGLFTYAKWWIRSKIQHACERERASNKTGSGCYGRCRGHEMPPPETSIEETFFRAPSIDDKPEDMFLENERREALERWMRTLSERQRFVMMFRAGGDTLQEIGDALGVSRERIRQIEAKACRIMRREAARDMPVELTIEDMMPIPERYQWKTTHRPRPTEDEQHDRAVRRAQSAVWWHSAHPDSRGIKP